MWTLVSVNSDHVIYEQKKETVQVHVFFLI